MTRRFIDAPDALRCTATITLTDKSKARCGRYAKVEELCTQHAKMFGLIDTDTIKEG